MVVVVTGVSGSGKSTVGALLARHLGWRFADGDDFHTPESIAKMRGGHPLSDDDRAPWLRRISDWIGARLASGECGVIACSALKRGYRDAIRRGRAEIRIAHLDGPRALIVQRLAERHGHFMPASLLDSQLAGLEAPGHDEHAIVVGIAAGPDEIAATIAARLGVECSAMR